MFRSDNLKSYQSPPEFITQRTQAKLAREIFKRTFLLLVGIPLAFGQKPTMRQRVIADGQQAIPGSIVTGAAANDITMTVDPPTTTAECFPGGYQKLSLTNRGQKAIFLTVSHQYWLSPAGPAVGDPPAAPGITPNGTVIPTGPAFSPGCTVYFNGNVINPQYYVIVYTIEATYQQSQQTNQGGGGPSCTPGSPRITSCPAVNVPDGLYYLSAAQLSFPAVFQNGQLTDRGGRICIDVRTQDFRYQQLKCEDGPTQMFNFERSDNGCYLIRQALPPNRLTLPDPASDNDGVADLFGWTDTMVSGCAFDQARIRWELEKVWPPSGPDDIGDFHIKNQATGKCVQIDGSQPVQPTGTVNAISNCTTKYQEWLLKPVPAR